MIENPIKHQPNPECKNYSPEMKAYRLSRVRKMANLSRNDFKNKYHINADTYKGWELAKHGGLSLKGAREVIKALSTEGVYCTLEWLMYGIGNGPQITEFLPETQNHPLLSSNSPQSVLNNNEEKQIQQEIQAFLNGNSDAVGLAVTDDAMMPVYQIGDFIGGYKFYDSEINHALGLDCIIQTNDNQRLIRRIHEGSSKNCYVLTVINHLSKINSPIMHDVKLISAAPIIWIRRKLHLNCANKDMS